MEQVICQVCWKEFKVEGWRKDKAKYCSYKCYWESMKGKRFVGDRIELKGKDHPGWKGGRISRKNGYIYIKCHSHPSKVYRNYVAEHRLVMEKHIGRYLDPKEVVHHENEIRDDNRIENLKLFKNNREHMRYHHAKA